jgi:hypothetical protein
MLRLIIEWDHSDLKEGSPEHQLYMQHVGLMKIGVNDAPKRVILQLGSSPNTWHEIAEYPIKEPLEGFDDGS